MSAFLTALLTRTLSAAECDAAGSPVGLFQLVEDFIYRSELLKTDIKVEAGFVTDYASIPVAARWYVDGDDPCIAFPSVVHDWIYSHRGVMPDGLTFTRDEADDMLIEAMDLCGARMDQRLAVRAAVRFGGAAHWKP